MQESTDDKLRRAVQTIPKAFSNKFNLAVAILMACLVLLAGIYSSWILFLSFALLPSLLVRWFDKSEKKTLSISVVGLNVTGTMLALQHSYRTYGTSPLSGVLFQDWINWALTLGAAWIGGLFFIVFPAVFAAVMEIIVQYKEKRLKNRQKALISVWGQKLKRDKMGADETQEKDKHERRAENGN